MATSRQEQGAVGASRQAAAELRPGAPCGRAVARLVAGTAARRGRQVVRLARGGAVQRRGLGVVVDGAARPILLPGVPLPQVGLVGLAALAVGAVLPHRAGDHLRRKPTGGTLASGGGSYLYVCFRCSLD